MNVVITGASRGIGKAIANRFAAAGHTLLLSSKHNDWLTAAVDEIKSKYPQVKVLHKSADLSVKDEVMQLAAWCNEQGNTDILINNAGIYFPGNIHDEPDGQLEKTMAINLFSAYHLTRAILPGMIRNKSGHIFNICSIASLDAYEGGGSYSISKYALNGFSKNLRNELMPHHIKVTSVFPGAVHTDSWGDFDNSHQRIMEADDIAQMIYAATMLSPQAVVDEITITPQLGAL